MTACPLTQTTPLRVARTRATAIGGRHTITGRFGLGLLGAIVLAAGLGARDMDPATPARLLAGQAATPTLALEVAEASIADLQGALDDGRVTSVELVEQYLARIEAYDQDGPALNSIILIDPSASDQAAALDRERADTGPRGALHGIPILVKDNYDVAGLPTTGGSIALASHLPPDDGFLVRKLREAGAVILGKTNLHELAMGITTIASFGGQTRNPYDPRRNPGGSSGGTGAAVAASFAAAAMGSDTCGSIRIPSSHNNLVGLRGTAGLSSRDGILPLSHTQDIGGPLARTVADLAVVLDATVGPDADDPVTVDVAGRPSSTFTERLDPEALQGARIGLLSTLFGDTPEDAETGDVVRGALERMQELGVETPEVEIADYAALMQDSGVIPHEFKFDLIDYLSASGDAPVESLTDILDGGLYHAALETRFRRRNEPTSRDNDEYRAALAKRIDVRRAIESILDEQNLDALAYPTIRRIPALVGEPQFGSNCALSAHSGLPAISFPAGVTVDGIPVGIELIGRTFADADLVSLAYAWEQATSLRRPPATTPPLIDGLAPAPITFDVSADPSGTGSPVRATLRVTFDVVRSELAYAIRVEGVAGEDVLGGYLQRAAAGANGPILHQVLERGWMAEEGTVALSPRDVDDLAGGRVYFQLYTRGEPGGSARSQLIGPPAASARRGQIGSPNLRRANP